MSRATGRKIPQQVAPTTTSAPRRVLVAMVVFCALALVLNAESLHRAASRMPDTWRRQVALAVTERVAPAARALHLTAPRSTLGHVREELQGSRGVRVIRPARDGAPSVLLVGDSVMENIAPPLGKRLSDRMGASVEQLTQRGIALGLPELYDWPAEVRKAAARTHADLVIVLITAEPYQGRPLQPGDPRYAPAYRKLIVELLDAASSGGAQVVWLERPPVEDPTLQARLLAARRIVREEVRRTPDGVFLRVASAVAGTAGEFEEYRSVAGRTVRIRTADGIHLTPAGADLYAAAAMDALSHLVYRPTARGVE